MPAIATQFVTNVNTLSGIQRAAILVMYLKREIAGTILDKLGVDELQQISNAMVDVEYIAPEVIEQVVREFVQDLWSMTIVPGTGPRYALEVLPGLIDEDKRQKVIAPIKRRLSTDFADFIGTRPDAVVAAVLKDEHPQTQALAMLLMGAEHASRIMALLEEQERYDLAIRMARIDQIPSEMADDVERSIMEALDDHGTDLWRVEGVDRAARVLGQLDMMEQELLLGQIADEDEDLSVQLRKRMVTFDDLGAMDSRSVQMLLRNVDRETLVVALRGASTPLRELFLGNMSKRAAQDLEEDLEIGKPVPRTRVEDAQEEIVNAAMRLRDEGVVTLSVGGVSEDMV